ncbi:MAG: glycosyltransferase family 9 protein, partial [Gemmatimonadota bacterium]|nr:glycosyltransferase family 9 protein [Gemmatimonadota bacterium]
MVRLSAIGDTVHAVPVAASIRRAWPDCHLTWVIQPVPHELMRGRPDVDEFLLFHRKRGWRAYRDFQTGLADRRFDLVVNLHPYLKAGIVTRMLRAPVRVGYDRHRARDLSWLATNRRIPARAPRHVQDQYFEFLEYLGVPVIAEWDFHFTPDEVSERNRWREAHAGRPVLAVSTRSSRRDKDWTLARYARVLDVASADFGLRTVLIGGASAGEASDAAWLAEACADPP